MDVLIIVLVLAILFVNIAFYLRFKKEPKSDENEFVKIKDDINTLKSSLGESFNSMSKEVAKDMTGALTRVDEKVAFFNRQVEDIQSSQNNFSRILAGVKQYGGLSEFSLANLLQDLLPSSQYIANAKMRPEENRDVVEFAIKLQDNFLPIDSHWPIEKYKAVDEAFQNKDKESLALARNELALAFRAKSKLVNQKYINPPITTDFAIVYVPTEGLYAELASYRDPKTKELLMEELRKKYKISIAGPNTICALIQSFHLGFQTLKVQKHATQIYDDLKIITTRFSKHFENVLVLRKKLEEAMSVVDSFGKDARSITRTLENIKDPDQFEKAVETENVKKFAEHSKQLKN
tara:strand:+ start:320 stop:1366 length:1047 start_codon:yes stop_codon:yes gene_type:complete